MKTKMKLTRRFFSILFTTSLLFACSDDGEDGAIGPQGAQGEQGPAGAQGEEGADGEIGTANVIYSDWIPSGFEADEPGSSAIFDMDAPQLTSEIINQGVVLAYGRLNVGEEVPDVLPLPVYIPTLNESYYHRIETVGELQIRILTDDGSPVGGTLFDDYRYILIPGGTPASGKSSTMDYTKMTYEEVATHFGIED